MLRKRMLSAALAGLFAAVSLAGTPAVASAGTTEAAVQANLDREVAKRAAISPAAAHVCYAVHVAFSGWLEAVCDGEEAGIPWQAKQIEAIRISVSPGSVCYEPHLQDIGWAGESCNNAVAGTTGQSRRLEALTIRGEGGVRICYTAMGLGYDYDDQGPRCQNDPVGTTGQGRYMSGIKIWTA
jgi:hypothetical protein